MFCSISGYKHGCKVAVLDHQGKVLKTDVVYLQNLKSSSGKVCKKQIMCKFFIHNRIHYTIAKVFNVCIMQICIMYHSNLFFNDLFCSSIKYAC